MSMHACISRRLHKRPPCGPVTYAKKDASAVRSSHDRACGSSEPGRSSDHTKGGAGRLASIPALRQAARLSAAATALAIRPPKIVGHDPGSRQDTPPPPTALLPAPSASTLPSPAPDKRFFSLQPPGVEGLTYTFRSPPAMMQNHVPRAIDAAADYSRSCSRGVDGDTAAMEV